MAKKEEEKIKELKEKNNNISKSKKDKNNILKDEKVKKTLKLNLRNSILFNIVEYFFTSFIDAYVVLLGFLPNMISFIITLPQFFTSIIQLFTNNLVEKYGRKKVFEKSILIQALSILFFVTFSLLLKEYTIVNLLFMIFFITIFFSSGMIAYNVWVSIMGELVPENIRGKYFSYQGRLMSMTAIISLIIVSFILKYFDDIKGFLIIFFVAFTARILSYYIARQYYVLEDKKLDRKEYFSLFDFVKRAKYSNFAKYTFFYSLFLYSVFIVAPILSYYQLKILHFSYFQFTLLKIAFFIGSFLSLKFWGNITDKYGNRIVFFYTGFFISFGILAYIFFKDFNILMIIEFYSGIVWSGFNLSTANYILDAVTTKKRTLVSSYFNFFKGLSIMLAGFSTFLLLDFFKKLHYNEYTSIFLLSGILRILVVLLFFRTIYEVRSVLKKNFLEIMFNETFLFRIHRRIRVQNFKIKNVGKVKNVIKENLKKITRKIEEAEDKKLKEILE